MTHASHFMKKFLATSTVFVFLFSLSVVPDTHAMIAPAPQASAVQDGSDAAQDRQQVQAFLETKIVRQRLSDLGMSESEINERLSRLSDKDVQQVAMHIRQQTPAGDGEGFLVSVLVIAVLVMLIIYLAKRI